MPSKDNGISDCFSHLYNIILVSQYKPEFSIDEPTHLQANDSDICAANEYLSTGRKAFTTSQLGSLQKHRIKLTLSSTGLLLCKSCLVIPKALHSKVLMLCHDHPFV